MYSKLSSKALYFYMQNLCVCLYVEIRGHHSFVCVCVCVHAPCCVVVYFFFLTGILSMNSSDWIKYHNAHQDRFRQSDYLFLCHHFFLFQQQKASKDSLRTEFHGRDMIYIHFLSHFVNLNLLSLYKVQM